MSYDQPPLASILEAMLAAAGGPVSLERMQSVFEEHEMPSAADLREALSALRQQLQVRGLELVEVASGYRLQVRASVAPWVARLWEERPQRYSRALLETLALIAYRQPITRGDIEDVRGVVVSSSIMKTLLEREWVRVVGHRDVPGRPAMYATTRQFLDYFGLKSLDDMPSLQEIRELDDANRKLQLGDDADVRQETPGAYDFSSSEDVEQRGADVLADTEHDLNQAAALVAKVEAGVFQRDEQDEAADQRIDGPRDSETQPVSEDQQKLDGPHEQDGQQDQEAQQDQDGLHDQYGQQDHDGLHDQVDQQGQDNESLQQPAPTSEQQVLQQALARLQALDESPAADNSVDGDDQDGSPSATNDDE